MLEQEDFKIKQTDAEIREGWFAWVFRKLLEQCLKRKPKQGKIDDIRISGNTYGDTEIKPQVWGRRDEHPPYIRPWVPLNGSMSPIPAPTLDEVRSKKEEKES